MVNHRTATFYESYTERPYPFPLKTQKTQPGPLNARFAKPRQAVHSAKLLFPNTAPSLNCGTVKVPS